MNSRVRQAHWHWKTSPLAARGNRWNPAIVLFALAGLLLTGAPERFSPESRDPATAKIADTGAAPKQARTMRFERNLGQTHRQVDFVARAPGYTLFLTASEAVMALSGKAAGDEAAKGSPRAVRMRLVGANATARPHQSGRLPGVGNYLLGSDSQDWITGVPGFASITYDEVYPGIGLAYHGRGRNLEYDFHIAPHADPDAIALSFSGVRKLKLSPRGELLIRSDAGTIRQARPVAYQIGPGGRTRVASRYRLLGSRRVQFDLGDYDARKALVIDPVVAVAYSTYLGGTGDEDAGGIAVDAYGNAYLAGTTKSLDFPKPPGSTPLQSEKSADYDVFVTKLSPDGSTQEFSTYLGGGANDIGAGVAVDALGHPYVGGIVHSNAAPSPEFPTTPGAFDSTCDLSSTGRCGAGFIAKLNNTGTGLLYSTYIRGVGQIRGIATDPEGNAYVVGPTTSESFPATANAYQPALSRRPGSASAFDTDAFLLKLDPTRLGDGSGVPSPGNQAVLYATYLGGRISAQDSGNAVATGPAGTAYITGISRSQDFPTTPTAFQPAATDWNAFVAVFDTTLEGERSLVYSTLLGGPNDQGGDVGNAIAVDQQGNAYITGQTPSAAFPTTPNAYQKTAPMTDPFWIGTSGTFVAKIDPSKTGVESLVYSSYLTSFHALDRGTGVAVDPAGHMYVTGWDQDEDFPTKEPFQTPKPENVNGFLAKLDPAASGEQSLIYSGLFGGSDSDISSGVGLDCAGNVYVAGGTDSPDWPTVAPVQPGFGGGSFDAFVTKLSPVPAPEPCDLPPPPAPETGTAIVRPPGPTPIASNEEEETPLGRGTSPRPSPSPRPRRGATGSGPSGSPADEAFASTVTVGYSRLGRRFRGIVRSEEALCGPGRKVVVKKVKRGKDAVIGSGTSKRTHEWAIRRAPKRAGGRFYAVVKPSIVSAADGLTILCRRDRSVTITRRR